MRTPVLVTVAAMAVVSGCSGDQPPATPALPGVNSSTSTLPPVRERPVPKSCGALATLDEVSDILNAAVTGQTLPIVGVPEPKIGRTARLDCYYGVAAGQQASSAAVWIGLASYTDEAAAKRRMDGTVTAARETGARAADVAVGTDRGVLLSADKPTLVAVRGKNTVVVTVAAGLLAEDQAASLLGRLAEHALTGR